MSSDCRGAAGSRQQLGLVHVAPPSSVPEDSSFLLGIETKLGDSFTCADLTKARKRCGAGWGDLGASLMGQCLVLSPGGEGRAEKKGNGKHGPCALKLRARLQNRWPEILSGINRHVTEINTNHLS